MIWLRRFLFALFSWLTFASVWVALGPTENDGNQADAAIVLGAAVNDTEPSPVFAARIDHAITLFRNGRVPALIFTGARSDEDGFSEAAAARQYAVDAGVPAEAVLIEEKSRTTFQNLVEAKAVASEAGIDNVLIVSDPLHLRRALVMADSLGLDAQASATSSTRYRSWRTKLPFLAREVYFLHHFWVFGE